MKLETDFRKINELLSKANEINGKLIDLSDAKRDHFYSLKANSCKDIWITEHHNKHISSITQTIKRGKLELLKQLDEIKKQIEEERICDKCDKQMELVSSWQCMTENCPRSWE